MTLLKKYFCLVTSLFVFIMYLFTLAPSVVQIDSGELAAVQATLGIAHPTGYPLFTILGYLFSLIPLPFTKIFQLNILAAIYCSAAVGVFTYTIKYCLDNLSSFKTKSSVQKESSKKEKKKGKYQIEKTDKQDEPSENIKLITAIFGGLILAFSRTFWFQSTSVEVYSLHLLLITLIILFLLKAYLKSFESIWIKGWIYCGIFIGLGFSNHMSTLFLIWGMSYILLITFKQNVRIFLWVFSIIQLNFLLVLLSKFDLILTLGKFLIDILNFIINIFVSYKLNLDLLFSFQWLSILSPILLLLLYSLFDWSKVNFDIKQLNKTLLFNGTLIFIVMILVLVINYSYLPIRASSNPTLNWGNPIDFEKIIRHITGKQYQVWLFASIDSARNQLAKFIFEIPIEFGAFIQTKLKLSINYYDTGLSFAALIPIVGFFNLLMRARRLFLFVLITFVFSLLYSINYDIHDIDSYFLLAFIMLSFFAAFGALKILEMKSLQKNLAIIILAGVLAIQLFFNFLKLNQSGVYTFEDYTKSVLNTVPENSIIFSIQWDYFISASYYYQFVEDYRRDVTVIDKELLRRSWYYNQINNQNPEVLSGVKNEIDQFLIALKPFERDEKFDPNRLENLYKLIMTNLIRTNIKERDYFIAPELVEQEMKRGEFKIPEGYNLVPHLFFYKVVAGNEYVPAPDPDFSIRIAANRNVYIDKIENFIGRMLSNRAYYEVKFGRSDRAKIYLKKILNDLPGFKLHPALQEVLKN